MNELKAFTNSDWDGYAGASNLPDGSPPQIGYVVLPNKEDPDCDGGATIIVSGCEGSPDFGTVVEVNLSVYPATEGIYLSAPMKQAMAMFVAEHLTATYCTPDSLTALGFDRIG